MRSNDDASGLSHEDDHRKDAGQSSRNSALQGRMKAASALLEELAGDPEALAEVPLADRERLLRAAGLFARPSRSQQKRMNQAARRKARMERKEAEDAILSKRAIRRLRAQAVFETPLPLPPTAALPGIEAEGSQLEGARPCYVCKGSYDTLHFFYDQLCPRCGDANFAKRTPTADLGGRRALVTGARVKIGYQAAIMLLRAGAHVIVTTRFPRDAARRYASESDFGDWQERLEIFGLDLRHTPSVEAFCSHALASQPHLDFLINNACQTVRKPPDFYAHLMELERAKFDSLPADQRKLLAAHDSLRAAGLALRRKNEGEASIATAGLIGSAELSQLALADEDVLASELSSHFFPEGQLDADLQQVDLRTRNSWRLPLAEVSSVELIEVQLVNAIAPFVLNARLKPLMLRTNSRDKHIVNVSAMEGQFYRSFKTDKHPHTNMAKAALNMMTRTSAADFIKDGIHMNSVDTGWVTDEDPADIARRKTREHGFHPPLDIVDGAARIVAPIFEGVRTGKHVWGQFLKDYAPTPW